MLQKLSLQYHQVKKTVVHVVTTGMLHTHVQEADILVSKVAEYIVYK